MNNWPRDADGDVFRRLEKDKFDFNELIVIDFNVDFDHWPLTSDEKKIISNEYPSSRFIDTDENGYVLIQVNNQLSYDFVIGMQNTLTKKFDNIGGLCESWGVMNG